MLTLFDYRHDQYLRMASFTMGCAFSCSSCEHPVRTVLLLSLKVKQLRIKELDR